MMLRDLSVRIDVPLSYLVDRCWLTILVWRVLDRALCLLLNEDRYTLLQPPHPEDRVQLD